MHRHPLVVTLAIAVLAAACGKSDSKPSANAAAKPNAAGDPAPAVAAVSQLQLLADYVPPLPASADDMDVWEVFELATEKGSADLLARVGPVPPNDAAVFLADVRIIGERDLAFGRLTPETTTLAHIEQVIAHIFATSVSELRGYRPRGHKLFVSSKQHDRKALAVEALAYLKAHGFEDPGDLDADNRVTIPQHPPITKAVWEGDRKRYDALVLRKYGRLAWVAFAPEGSAWIPVTELDPAPPEGPAPQETCTLAVGAKVNAPWSTTRTKLWKGTITEIYGGMARVKFDDKSTGWAHCTLEIKPR